MTYAQRNRNWMLALAAATSLTACVRNAEPVVSAYQPSPREVSVMGAPTAGDYPAAMRGMESTAEEGLTLVKKNLGVIETGKIYLRRQKAYVPPPAPEALEAKIERVVATRLTDAEQRLKSYTDSQVGLTAEQVAAKNEAFTASMVAQKSGETQAALDKAHAELMAEVQNLKAQDVAALAEADKRLAAAAIELDKVRVATQLAEERAKLYAAEQTLAVKKDAESAQKAALLAEERSKLYAAEQSLAVKKDAETALKEAALGEERAKTYAMQQAAVAQRDALLAQQKAELSNQSSMAAIQRTQDALVNAVAGLREGDRAVLAQVEQKAEANYRTAQLEMVALKSENQLSEERAKRYAAEQDVLLGRDVSAAAQKARAEYQASVLAAEEKLAATTLELEKLRGETALSEQRAKLYAAEQGLVARQTAESLQKDMATSEQRAKTYAAEQAAVAQRDALLAQQNVSAESQKSAIALQRTHDALVNAVASLRENQRAGDADILAATEQKLAATNVELEKLRLTAQLGEERAKRYAAEQVHIIWKDNQDVRKQAELAENRAKLYAAERSLDAVKLAESAQGAARMAEERSKRFAMESEQRSKDYTIAQVALAQTALADLKTQTAEAVAKLQVQAKSDVAELELRTAEADKATRAAADAKAADIEKRLQAYAEKKAQDVLQASTASLANSEERMAELVVASRLSPDEIRAIAETTLSDSSDTIRAMTLQTLADSGGYIKTVAREAVQDETDPTMRNALADAAKKAILDENGNVAFAIRRMVKDELKDNSKWASNSMTSNDGIMISSTNIIVGALTEPGETGEVGRETKVEEQYAMAQAPRHRSDWVNIRDYHVVVHDEDETLQNMLMRVVKKAEPFTGPWEVKWKISQQNQDILQERFSLDAETTFEQFASYLAQYLFNSRGVQLNFNMFDSERVLVVSDE
ncbi:MAG: hypothetical protein WAX89_02535 [Alphaproteobacteria bacterium]